MNGATGITGFSACVSVAIQVGVVWALFRWAGWISRLYGAPRWAKYLPWPMLAGWALGFAATIYGLTRAFASVQDARAEDRARSLAEGISEAMNGTAFAVAWFLAGALLLLALTWRYHWAARKPEAGGDPPYR